MNTGYAFYGESIAKTGLRRLFYYTKVMRKGQGEGGIEEIKKKTKQLRQVQLPFWEIKL